MNTENRVLITGCEGFIGSFLAEFLVAKGLDVSGIVLQDNNNLDHIKNKINLLHHNLTDKENVFSIVNEVKPNYVFHLAAQSNIPVSWQDPETTFNVNVLGTVYLLDSIRKVGIDPIIEIACSSDEYASRDNHDSQISESAELSPSSPYGVSKLAQDMLGNIYHKAYGMKIIRIRPFAIIGPRKTGDACSDFVRGIVEIERGKKGNISVGNLETVRDFVDVRDAVKAMWLIAEKGISGQVYNICSGKGHRIQDILDKLISFSSNHIEAVSEHNRMRPSDKPVIIGNNSKLRKMGWKPEIPMEKTLTDILTYWREKK